MPFREIKPSSNFIRIKKDGSTTVSVALVNKYFKNKKIRVFHDKESKKIGLQPSDEGYKIGNAGGSRRFYCSKLSKTVVGEFYPLWSEKHKMLIFEY